MVNTSCRSYLSCFTCGYKDLTLSEITLELCNPIHNLNETSYEVNAIIIGI